MINVIYDISLLGTAFYFERIRNGIARTIEGLLLGMKDVPGCSLTFSAYNTPEQLVQSQEYVAAHPSLSSCPLCRPTSSHLNLLLQAARQLYPSPEKAVAHRYRRRAVSFVINRVAAGGSLLDNESISSADVLHSSYYPLPQRPVGSARLQRFLTIYDMIPLLFPEYFEPQIVRNFTDIIRSIRPDDWVLAISESTKNDFCAWTGFDPARVFVTPLAASNLFYYCNDPLKNSQVRSRYGIPDGPYALSLCTLEPRKNIDHTIRCFVKTIREQRIPDLNLVLVGTKGWNFERIFTEIAHADDIRERIFVTGYVPDEELASLYSAAMMFVCPSLYEGFGLPLLEAMQCGVPVISSNSSSLPEVVGSAGLMVSPTDGDALCQAFWDLYRSSELRGEMSRKSLVRAERFSWEQCAEDTVAAYRVATAGNSGR